MGFPKSLTVLGGTRGGVLWGSTAGLLEVDCRSLGADLTAEPNTYRVTRWRVAQDWAQSVQIRPNNILEFGDVNFTLVSKSAFQRSNRICSQDQHAQAQHGLRHAQAQLIHAQH